jgi:hypothetical protein
MIVMSQLMLDASVAADAGQVALLCSPFRRQTQQRCNVGTRQAGGR